jgi:hypothetical protein
MAAPEAAAAHPPVEEVLSREAERSPRAGYASLVAAVLTIVAGVALQAIYADIPRVPLIDSLREAAGQDIGRPGLLTDKIHFYDDKSLQLILVSLAQAAGALCIGYVLVFLHDATSWRGGAVPRLARLGAMFGAVATAVGSIGLQVTAAILSHDFVTGSDQGTQAAHDALRSGVLVAAQFVGFLGTLALALSFVLISLNAMRAGLLTRFMGILGVIVGVLLIIPLGSPVPIVQAFWLAAMGALLLGRWPSGVPAAWREGRAVPWPTQQEIREARERAAGRKPATGSSEAAGPASEETARAGEPSPATSRKKRKRRA